MKVKKDGSWNTIKDRAAVYKENAWNEGDLMIKVPGKGWKMLVPPNAIILYDKLISDGYQPNGANETPNLMNRFISTDFSHVMKLIGNDSHTGESHGPSSGTTNQVVNPRANSDSTGGHDESHTTALTHAHTVPSHSHTEPGVNSSCAHVDLFANFYSKMIRKDALILSESALVSAYMSIFNAYNNYYLRLSDHFSLNAAVPHDHGGFPLLSSAYVTSGRRAGNAGSNRYRTHTHTFTHEMDPYTIHPSARRIKANRVSEDIWFDDLPSGAAVLFTSNRLPKGWSHLFVSSNSLLLFSSLTGAEGTSTHKHSSQVITSTAFNGTQYGWARNGSYTSEKTASNNHTHTVTDYHETVVNHMPPSVCLAVGVKA